MSENEREIEPEPAVEEVYDQAPDDVLMSISGLQDSHDGIEDEEVAEDA